MDYRETVHLPKTDFPMRAALSEREPAQVKAWEDDKVYENLLAKNAGEEKFVFHDGPAYATGPIHQRHYLNKITKDLVVRCHLQAGRLRALSADRARTPRMALGDLDDRSLDHSGEPRHHRQSRPRVRRLRSPAAWRHRRRARPAAHIPLGVRSRRAVAALRCARGRS